MDKYIGMDISQFYNNETLNIFCDASIVGKPDNFTGCYGVVAVVKDNIIDTCYRIVSNTTNNNSEIKGLRAAISMAYKWKDNFSNINIFCDSQVSVFGLRDYIYKWSYNPKNNMLYTSSNKPAANQSVIIECHYMMKELMNITNCNIRIFHQAGHVGNTYNSINEASCIFAKSNNIIGKIDLNLIRYISTYNNYVDQNSRRYLKKSDLNIKYFDPVSFVAKGRINRY